MLSDAMLEQARRQQASTGVALLATDGHNSDEEVYAAAAAADEGAEYDSSDDLVIRGEKKAVEPLPAVDHDDVVYDDFNKDFYQEPEALMALSPAEVRNGMHACMLNDLVPCAASVTLREADHPVFISSQAF